MFNRMAQDGVREAVFKFLATSYKELPRTPQIQAEISEHLLRVLTAFAQFISWFYRRYKSRQSRMWNYFME